jgi:hypothetical protein
VEALINALMTKETVFFCLFVYLLYIQQQEKKSQNDFLLKQQDILGELTSSFEKLATNQEKLTERIERIEVTLDKNMED